MYQSADLQKHIEQSSSVNVQALVLAEWNLNFADNVKLVGNYRWRNGNSTYGTISSSFNPNETNTTTNPTYYNALISYNTPFRVDPTDNTTPVYYQTDNQKEKLLYSLTDCLGRFRPRSGINKMRFLSNGINYIGYANEQMHLFPRYYLSSKEDKFKYWTSYRKETSSTIRGLSKTSAGSGNGYYIDDANPFVVYNRPVPANRIVIKMQTNTSSIASTISNVTQSDGTNKTSNPFYEDPKATTVTNQTTPLKWYIEYLDANNGWQVATAFDKTSLRSDGTRIIGSDGYVEIGFGLTNIPSAYTNNFVIMGSYISSSSLPAYAQIGEAYLVGAGHPGTGTFYVWNGSAWDSFVPSYGWMLMDSNITAKTTRLTNLVSPDYYGSDNSYTGFYREFQYIQGIRVRVETMAIQNATFDLIEMSPRLVADLSDKTVSYSLSKIASDIGNTGMPVGQLLTSTGSIELFDYDQAFNQNNPNSLLNILDTDKATILSSFITKNLKISFYEVIKNVTTSNIYSYNYYVPIKTMYADGFPEINNSDRKATIQLRNLYFYLESLIAPSMLHRNISFSQAVSILLDSVGFSNYKFDRISGNNNDKDEVIPFFFVAPDTTVAQVLNDLAVSTQTAIFFNEQNDLVFMSRNRMIPASTTEKATDITLYGTKDFSQNGAIKNTTSTNQKLSNIINIASQTNDVFNAGKITYVNRYIQKSYLDLKQASQLNNNRSYQYKPVLLWEASGTENVRPENDDNANQSGFSLGAVVLNSDIPQIVPTVSSNGNINNNIIDLGNASGNSAYYLSRYNSYLYADGEIIKYDAIEYSISSIKKYGLVGNTISGSGTITLTTQSAYSLSIGDVLVPTSGTFTSGTDTTSVTVTGIKSSTEITISQNAGTTGQVTFTASASNNNVWITSAQEYQNYFNKVAFSTKIYPTGRVRIFTEPYYNADGTIKTDMPYIDIYGNPQTGAVAKHGRGQFGTTIKPHYAGNSLQSWSINNVLQDSDYIYKNPYFGTTVTYSKGGTVSGSKNITVTESTSQISVGWYVFGTGIPSGSKVASINTDKLFSIDKNATSTNNPTQIIVRDTSTDLSNTITYSGKAGVNTADTNSTASKQPLIRDTFSQQFVNESDLTVTNPNAINPAGTIKSSALTLKGNDSLNGKTKPLDYVSYTLKTLTGTNFNHYGTRMRIIGTQQPDQSFQTPVGSQPISTVSAVAFSGASGGMCLRVDQTTNTNIGYYFEITALNQNNVLVSQLSQTVSINNVYFYKIVKKVGSSDTDKAIPILLWSGLANINVDNGTFTSTQRLAKQTDTTSYDLVVETQKISDTQEKFFLYINDSLVATITDKNPIPQTTTNNTVGMFIRGTSKCMFENIYALTIDPSKTATASSNNALTPLSTIDTSNLFPGGMYSKYGVSSSIANTYISGLSSSDTPAYNLEIDEFGTILREVAYMNVRYDKAYPAIFAKVAPTYNAFQSYAISGFNANAYSAEFLVINITDSIISLDETSSNYLRIYGIAPTQQSSHDLTVDEYFVKNSDFSNPQLNATGQIIPPSSALQTYSNIQSSRITYGRKEFTIAGPYIQTESSAKKLMEWMVNKNMKKQSRRSVGVEIFANPMIQLGDIVDINYQDTNGVNQVSYSGTRFVVYNIEYKRSSDGPTMTLYLSEVG
jgi:hypothetical protein